MHPPDWGADFGDNGGCQCIGLGSRNMGGKQETFRAEGVLVASAPEHRGQWPQRQGEGRTGVSSPFCSPTTQAAPIVLGSRGGQHVVGGGEQGLLGLMWISVKDLGKGSTS